jgi:hypothetical protein
MCTPPPNHGKPAIANWIFAFSVLSQLDRLRLSTNCLAKPLGFTLSVLLLWDAISRSRSRARIRSRSELTALMRRDNVSGWSQGIAAVRTVAAAPSAANSIARKWESENLATIWSSMGSSI